MPFASPVTVALVPVTLNTDDLTVSDTTLSEEYLRAATEIGMTLPELWATNLHALEVAFADQATRGRLRAEFAAEREEAV